MIESAPALANAVDVALGALDHQVHVDHRARGVDLLGDRLDDERAHRDRRDEVAVHHVDVDHRARRRPARSATCSPRRAKSAARIDGATPCEAHRHQIGVEHRALAVVARVQRGVRHAHDRRVLAAVRADRAQLEAVQAVHAAVAARAGSSGAATARGRTGRRRRGRRRVAHASPSSLGDEEAVGAVAVRERLQERAARSDASRAGASARRSSAAKSACAARKPSTTSLVLGGRDRAGRVDERAAGPERVARRRRRIARLQRGQRARRGRGLAPARVGARRRACRGRSTAGRRARGRRRSAPAARRRRAVRTSTLVAPMRCGGARAAPRRGRRAARRRRSRPRRPSARRGGWSCRRARRTGRARARPAAGRAARATAIAARDCGMSRPVAPTAGEPNASNGRVEDQRLGASRPGARRPAGARRALGAVVRSVLARSAASAGSLSAAISARGVVGAERLEPQLGDPLGVRVARARPAAGVPSGSAPTSARASRAARRRTALTSPAPRGRVGLGQLDRLADRRVGGHAVEEGELEDARAAARRAPAGRARSTGRPARRSITWSSVAARWTVPYASWVASARSRASSRSRAASPCSARSAHAPCSNTRRTTAYATRRAGLTNRSLGRGARAEGMNGHSGPDRGPSPTAVPARARRPAQGVNGHSGPHREPSAPLRPGTGTAARTAAPAACRRTTGAACSASAARSCATGSATAGGRRPRRRRGRPPSPRRPRWRRRRLMGPGVPGALDGIPGGLSPSRRPCVQSRRRSA